MGYTIKTKHGHDLLNATSAMQKAIRRGETKVAGYFALDLYEGGFYKYVWKRLLTISAEDCWGIITKEIKALHESFMFVNEKNDKMEKGRIFITKAVLILSEAKKSRDADHFQNLYYDQEREIDMDRVKELIEEVKDSEQEIPEYAYDVHTKEGRKRGKTKRDFFIDEYKALQPKQVGLFDLKEVDEKE